MRVYKYEVAALGNGVEPGGYVVELPFNAEVLGFGMQGYCVVMWANVDPDCGTVPRRYKVILTGEESPAGYAHRASVHNADRSFVVHVFEETK